MGKTNFTGCRNEISSLLFSRGLLAKDNPGVLQKIDISADFMRKVIDAKIPFHVEQFIRNSKVCRIDASENRRKVF